MQRCCRAIQISAGSPSYYHCTFVCLYSNIRHFLKIPLKSNFTTFSRYFANRKTDNNNNNEHINHPAPVEQCLNWWTLCKGLKVVGSSIFWFVVGQMIKTEVLRDGDWSSPLWGEKDKMHAWICKGLFQAVARIIILTPATLPFISLTVCWFLLLF